MPLIYFILFVAVFTTLVYMSAKDVNSQRQNETSPPSNTTDVYRVRPCYSFMFFP